MIPGKRQMRISRDARIRISEDRKTTYSGKLATAFPANRVLRFCSDWLVAPRDG